VPQNMSHVEHTSYISCALEHVSCWTPCIHQLCLRTCLMLNTVYIRCASEHVYVEHTVYISCASEHVSCWTLYTLDVPQNMSHVEYPVYTRCASQHVSCWHPLYVSCALEHVSCWTPCIHQLCLRTCIMLNILYTPAVPHNMSMLNRQ